jgi:hypothetical protein
MQSVKTIAGEFVLSTKQFFKTLSYENFGYATLTTGVNLSQPANGKI